MQYATYPSTNATASIRETQVINNPAGTNVVQTVETAGVPIDTTADEIRLRELYLKLAHAKKKYAKYVSVAATTPAYFWVPVAGTISAPVIAGVYGDRANKKKKLIERLQSEIAVLEYQLAQCKTLST
jgi:hypothetical protein